LPAAYAKVPLKRRKVWLWPFLAIAVLLLLALAFPPPAGTPAGTLVADARLLEDPSAGMTLKDVMDREQEFAPSTTYLAEGYTLSAFWLRITLKAPQEGGNSVVLRVYPPVLDQITVFAPDPSAPLGWTRSDLHLAPEQSLRGTVLTIPPEGKTVFVRVASIGSITAGVDVLTMEQSLSVGLTMDLVQFAYLALMGVLLVWSLRMFSLTGDRLFLGFSIVKTMWIAHNVVVFGYLPMFIHLWDGWQFPALRGLAIINSFVGFAFHRAVLARYDPPKASLRSLDVLTVVSVAMFILFLSGERALALRANGICIFLFPFAILANIALARKSAGAGLAALRAVYLLFCTTLFLWIFTLLGFAHAQASDRFSVILHGISTGLLMFILLRLHGRDMLAVLRQAEEALVTAETLRKLERRYSEIRLRFIDMLAHETRNALAVINMSVAGRTFGERQRERVRQTIADLDSIIERSTQLAQMQHQEADVALAGFDLVGLVEDVRSATGTGSRVYLLTPDRLCIQSDPVLVKVIVSNLVENALKYSDDASPVTIRLAQDGDMARIEVENRATSFGMPDPARVFSKFYRGERAQARFGSGLGLSIAQHLATVLGGTICYAPDGATVRFKVELPC